MNHKVIAISVLRREKAQRDKLSGVLRFAAGRSDWNVVIHEGKTVSSHHDAHICLYAAPDDGKTNIPTVCVDAPPDYKPNHPHLHTDNIGIGELAANLFIRRGLCNFGAVLCVQPRQRLHSVERIDGFRAQVRKAGYDVAVFEPQSTEEDEFLPSSSRFGRWLSELPKPCGVLAFCDRSARDILDTCRLERIRIPEQLMLIGVDNETDICEVTQPTLSTIFPDFESAGYLAAQTLDRILRGKPAKKNAVYAIKGLVERDSTRPSSSAGRVVSSAQKLLSGAQMPQTVAALAAALKVSVPTLNRSFRVVLGHGPKVELCHQRLEQIKTLLRDRSLSIAEISNRCQFAYPENLHLFFRHHTGMTPTQWRQQRT